jgi:hypothetical protein
MPAASAAGIHLSISRGEPHMAGDGMDVDLDDLRTMVTRLAAFKTEFEEIGDNTDDVAGAVGRPAGRSELRDKVDEFQGGWDGNRETVVEDLDKVYEHLKGFVDTIGELDVEMAKDPE